MCIEGLEVNHTGYTRVDSQGVPDEEESDLLVYRAYFGAEGEELGTSGDFSIISFFDSCAPSGIKKVRLYIEDSRFDLSVKKQK